VALPPLELGLDDLGRRVVPLQSLRYVLEESIAQHKAAGDVEYHSLELLLEAVVAAEDAPLPGHTPMRGLPEGPPIPGYDLAVPVADEKLGLVHPGSVE